ncbi:hypothetical protein Tco_0355170 [Tanacetum coccineum]
MFEVSDSDMPHDQAGNLGDNEEEPIDETASRCDWFKKPTPHQEPNNPDWNVGKTTKEECYKVLLEKLDWENPEGGDYPFDLSKPLPLITHGKRQRVTIPNSSSNNDLKGDVQSRMRCVYDKKCILAVIMSRYNEETWIGVLEEIINVTKPNTTRPDLRKRHPYTPYKDPQGFIYVDDFKRNRLICSDELYKFSDSTLTRLLSSLEDITKNIDMEYLSKRR